ncbi:T-complex protein 1 subunit zeta-2 [Kogia breviceps]|uniref:T-complex protein 1 subunit zeta-2 n=1 Tax=Kogia breviceps TaxID=27615 RepID=UPI0034D215C2
MKMLVSGAGDIKLTKDGNVLLHEMQIQHPTASLIVKVATAQDDITGDGTTSNVLNIGELLKQADLYISEAVVDSVLAIRRLGYPIDLFMVEIMEMKHKSETDTKLCLACGGMAVNSLEDLSIDCLGHAGLVHEYTSDEEKYTFIEDCVYPLSVTLLVKGPNKHTLTQIKVAVRDGLHAIKSATEDGCVVPGAGAVEVAIAEALVTYRHSIKGRARLGVQAFADALLIIPKVLAQNSGYDLQETLVKVQVEHSESKQPVGIDLNTGEPMVAADAGVWDNYCVKKQLLHSCTVIATNVLLVDEIMRAAY